MPSEIHKIRDNEVVLYKRPESSRWQARFKLPDGKWHHISTKRNNLADAKQIAADAYDEARFRNKVGQPPISRRFRDVARLAITEMDKALTSGKGKVAYKDYILLLEKYFIPFFGSKHIDKIAEEDIAKFEIWRKELMGKLPAASTLLNHNAAFRKVFETAQANGWVKGSQTLELKASGKKAQRRPDFTHEDWRKLATYSRHWIAKAPSERSKQMRELVWDYVMILSKTGMRTGREAMNLKWSQIRWSSHKGNDKFLLISVDGKTGKRELVARSGCEDYFIRIQQRLPDLAKLSFDELLTYAKVMYDPQGEKRTLYSLRHMYATSRLMIDKIPIHTLAVQMGTSVGMIEKHYSHLTAQMAADVLAGPRHDPEKAAATRAKKKAAQANVVPMPVKKTSKKAKVASAA